MIKKIKKLFNKAIELINRYYFWIILLFLVLVTFPTFIDMVRYLIFF